MCKEVSVDNVVNKVNTLRRRSIPTVLHTDTVHRRNKGGLSVFEADVRRKVRVDVRITCKAVLHVLVVSFVRRSILPVGMATILGNVGRTLIYGTAHGKRTINNKITEAILKVGIKIKAILEVVGRI